jgi:hypothetical protein
MFASLQLFGRKTLPGHISDMPLHQLVYRQKMCYSLGKVSSIWSLGNA